MDITMQQARENNLRLVVSFNAADGTPASIDSAHMVSSSNPEIASVLSQSEADGVHEVIYELHPVSGLAMLSGFADADLGVGERMLSWEFELNVATEVQEAETVSVSVGELVPKVVPEDPEDPEDPIEDPVP